MSEFYEIRNVQIENKSQIEQMGTKEKFWIVDKDRNERWLFKLGRQDTGEDWSEKIASEVAELIGLPHAVVELAICQDSEGIISKDFTEQKTKGYLVHGNELLIQLDPEYPSEKFRKVPQHSIDNIVEVLRNCKVGLPKSSPLPSSINTSAGLFLGYLMLDALIGNTDRHHENWGILLCHEESDDLWRIELAPTFDHASSLGRELSEENRERLLDGRDYNANIETYAQKARSAIYLNTNEAKPLSVLDAFVEFSKYAPEAKNLWLDKLAEIVDTSFRKCIDRVPKERLTDKSAEFAYRLLLFNKERLSILKS